MIRDYSFCPFCKGEMFPRLEEGVHRNSCQVCNFIHYRNPTPSAAGLLFREEKVLLIKRGVEPGYGEWSLPSGFIEEDETPEEGCIREIMEETGLTTSVDELLHIFTMRTEVYGSVMIIVYKLKEEGGELRPGSDVLDAKFCYVEEMPDLHLDQLSDLIKMAHNSEFRSSEPT